MSGQSRASMLDPEDPAVSKTGSPVMSIVLAAGMWCHCRPAYRVYKGQQRLSRGEFCKIESRVKCLLKHSSGAVSHVLGKKGPIITVG